MATPSPLLVIDLAEMRDRLAAGKAASSARYYTTALKRLEAFNGEPVLDLSRLTPGYIAGFRDYLIREKIAPTTVAQLLRCLRAAFKTVYGPERRAEFKRVFADVESANPKATPRLSTDELQKLALANLDGIEFLQKIRDVFMLAFYSGGLPLERLKKEIASLKTRGVDQQMQILRQFPLKHRTEAEDFIHSVSPEAYEKALDTIAYKLRLAGGLRPEAAATSWVEIARAQGISDDVAAAAATDETSFRCNLIKRNTPTAEMVRHTLERVANAIVDTVPRWYVMRCHDGSPQDTAERIRRDALPRGDAFFDTFTAPEGDTRTDKDPDKRIMAKMLFFHCTPDVAAHIRKTVATSAYVFTLAGSKTPAFIPDNEMRTFMFLCNVGASTIAYHFPAYEPKNIKELKGKTARITDGHFAGTRCLVESLAKERYKVVVRIAALGNLKITAEIPEEFLSFENE